MNDDYTKKVKWDVHELKLEVPWVKKVTQKSHLAEKKWSNNFRLVLSKLHSTCPEEHFKGKKYFLGIKKLWKKSSSNFFYFERESFGMVVKTPFCESRGTFCRIFFETWSCSPTNSKSSEKKSSYDLRQHYYDCKSIKKKFRTGASELLFRRLINAG